MSNDRKSPPREKDPVVPPTEDIDDPKDPATRPEPTGRVPPPEPPAGDPVNPGQKKDKMIL